MKKLFALLLLVLFSLSVNSQVFVAFEISEDRSELYPDEITTMFIVVDNQTSEKINLDLAVTSEQGISMFEGFTEVRLKIFTIKDVLPGKSEKVPIKIKAENIAVGEEKTSYAISADYTLNGHQNKLTTFIKTLPTPLSVKFRLGNTIVEEKEKNTVLFNFKNVDEEEIIKELKAEIIAPENYTFNSEGFTFDSIEPGVEVSNKAIEFSQNLRSDETGKIIARVVFNDSRGLHILEKSLSFNVQNKTFNLIFVVVILAVLFVVALITRRKLPKIKLPSKETNPDETSTKSTEEKESANEETSEDLKEENSEKKEDKGYFLKNKEN